MAQSAFQRFVLVAVVVSALLAVAVSSKESFSAGLSSSLNAETLARFQSIAKKEAGNNVHRLFQAARVYQRTGGKFTDLETHCSLVSAALANAKSELNDVFEALSAGKLIGCPIADPARESLTARLTADLESDEFVGFKAGFQTLSSLRLLGADKVSSDLVNDVVTQTLEKYEADNGLFGTDSDKSTGDLIDLQDTTYAIRLLAAARRLVALSDDSLAEIIEISEKIGEIASFAQVSSSGVAQFIPESKDLCSESVTRDYLVALHEFSTAFGLDYEIDQATFVGFSEFLVRASAGASCPCAASCIVDGLYAASRSSVGAPAAVEIATPVFRPSDRKDLIVRVTDAFGNPIPDAKVTLTRVSKRGQETITILSDHHLEKLADDASKHKMDFLALKPEFGAYNLEVSVEGKKIIAVTNAARVVKVYSSIEVSDVEVRVSDDADPHSPAVATYASSFPNKYEGKPSVSSGSQHLHVSFRVKSSGGKAARISQSFVRFTRLSDGAARTFPAAMKARSFNAHIHLAAHTKSFFVSTSSYSVGLVLGDSSVEKSIEYEFLELEVRADTGSNKKDTRPPEVVANMVKEYDTFPLAAQAEIKHVFRLPDERAPKFMSTLFTALVIAPLGLFVIFALRSGINFRSLPCSMFGFLSVLAFFGILATILVLLLVFWVQLTMFQLFHCLWPLVVALFVVGRYALRSLSGSPKCKQN